MEDWLEYLKSVKFEKNLKKLERKLKNKSIIIYGTGVLFQTIVEHFDLSRLNIIGISDKKYLSNREGQEDFGYKIIPFTQIVDAKPDYVLVSTLKFLPIITDFKDNIFKGTKTKILPLIDKPFLTLLKEIFE